ncbi:MAG: extracellular solute-binding protein [Ruminococcaceae bacterium]|nr:extracellular solute-binding protein [Oscillospiraceae bacterium]
MKKTLIRLITLSLAVFLLLAAVGCGGTKTNTPTVSLQTNASGDTAAQLEIQAKIKTMGEEITVLIHNSPESIECQMNSQRYKHLTGGKVTYISSNGYSEMQQKLASMHMTDEAPDIYSFTNQDYPSILYKDLLMPLDDVLDLNSETFKKEKIYIDGLRWDGKCYLIPNVGSDRDLWVNKQIFIDAGIPESEWPDAQFKAGTWTWDAFLDLVKRTSDADKNIYGFASGPNLPYIFAATAGADFVKLTENGLMANTKSEEITRAMNFMKSVITNPTYYPIDNTESAEEFFKRGQVAMLYNGIWISENEILGEQLQNGDIYLTSFPRDPKLDKHYRMGDIYGIAIPAGAKHVNGAVAYILSGYASDYYKNQIQDINQEAKHWTDETRDYIYDDLLEREAVLCISLGIKEIQRMTWDVITPKALSESNWETIANELDPKMQYELDSLG